ncbi:MAG: hypothetical protein WAV09_03085 [Minisyncoccia bacterium]
MSDLNPRVLLWLRAAKLTADDIVRIDPDEVRRIPVEGGERMWTLVYIEWSKRMYHEWAESLGFRGGNYFDAHDRAFLAGHTMEEHVAWVEAQIK